MPSLLTPGGFSHTNYNNMAWYSHDMSGASKAGAAQVKAMADVRAALSAGTITPNALMDRAIAHARTAYAGNPEALRKLTVRDSDARVEHHYKSTSVKALHASTDGARAFTLYLTDRSLILVSNGLRFPIDATKLA
jgi:hypothetical protein